jgi:hypothetical protein
VGAVTILLAQSYVGIYGFAKGPRMIAGKVPAMAGQV